MKRPRKVLRTLPLAIDSASKFRYTPALDTDIRKTFERARAQREANATEAEAKVEPIRKAVA